MLHSINMYLISAVESAILSAGLFACVSAVESQGCSFITYHLIACNLIGFYQSAEVLASNPARSIAGFIKYI